MDYLQKLVVDLELQSVTGIRECFENGISPNDEFKNKTLIFELISEYPRGPRFKECVKVFVDYGLDFDDKALLAVLLDDADLLEQQLRTNREIVHNKYSFDCAFTTLFEATLLHVCAEYNHLYCARILLKYGADVNAKAGVDEWGFGGQTPVFHTVNQNANLCIDVMNFLVSNGANLTYMVTGIIWGKGYEWETFVPAVNPISYALMGRLPQFGRDEVEIYQVVSVLMRAAYGIKYMPPNVPNAYLKR